MKEILRNKIHVEHKSHDVVIKRHYDFKVKFRYEAYNAVERCDVSILNIATGEWSHFASMLDVGVLPNSSSYVTRPEARLARAEDLFKKLEVYTSKII